MLQRFFQHDHRKNRGPRADVAGARRHRVGGGHAGAGVALGRADRRAGGQRAGGVQQAGARRRQGTGVLPGAKHPGQDVLQAVGHAGRRQQFVKGRRHGGVIAAGAAVDGEHARRIADAQHLLPGQLPVHIARQRRQERDLADVGFPVEDGLVEMRGAPPLGDVEVQPRRQRLGGLAGVGVAPGAERHKQRPRPVKGEVAVHHGRNAQRPHPGQFPAKAGLVVRRQGGVGSLDAGPHLLQVVGPVAALPPVFPVERAGGQHRAVRGGQYCLDAGGTQFQPQRCGGLLGLFHNSPPCVCCKARCARWRSGHESSNIPLYSW